MKQRDEMVSCLLEELVKVRQGLAESEDVIRNLKTKIQELEEVCFSRAHSQTYAKLNFLIYVFRIKKGCAKRPRTIQ